MVQGRQLNILRAIISEYVGTREPVSSKAVASRGELEVSSATIRNDMNLLEKEGLIFQPHTSAGRVPTEAGYRTFVDGLIDLRPLPDTQRRAIEEFLDDSVDFEDVIARTVRLLAQLTRSAAVAQLPTRPASRLRRVEVVDLASRWVIVIVVTQDGHVLERRLDMDQPPSEHLLTELRERLNAGLEGMTSNAIELSIPALMDEFEIASRGPAELVALTVRDMLAAQSPQRLVVAGLSNLARVGEDFTNVSGVLDALEQQVALLRLFAEVHTLPLQVSIGAENRDDELGETSVVSGAYQDTDDGKAHVGIVGPTRMDYPRSLIAVEAVSRYLSNLILEEQQH